MTIDERIEALVITAELQEHRLQKEQRRLKAAIRAALEAWVQFDENGDTPR